ncbi:MAG: right-handed parallel beta-helix repeat-containing protein, partial [bacterium]|nr:right-handed parallel beta-helix repeat-containing protein [bacterium]
TVTNPGNRSLQGPSGRATIQLTASAPVGTVMFSVNGDSCVFKDLVLDGGDLAGQAVHVNSSRKYITINNCEVRNIGGDVVEQSLGIKLGGAVRNITISDCSIHDVGGYEDGVTGNGAGAHRGVYIHYGGQNVRIENCVFSEIRGYEDGDAIHVYAYPPVKPGNVVIRGCTFTNIYKRAIKTQYVSGIVIEDCVIESLKTEDLACAKYAMGIMYCEDVSILNNDIFMERAAVVMELPGCSNLNIIGNSIVHDPNRLYASRTWGSWPVTVMLGTYDANPVFNCSVRDNFISGWRHGVHLSAGSMYNDIQYNEIHCPQYPIILYAEEEDNTVANNIIVME